MATTNTPWDGICGIDKGRSRATGDYRPRVHRQANFRLPLLAGRRAHQHRDQGADTGCLNNSGSGAETTISFEGKENTYLSNFNRSWALRPKQRIADQAHRTITSVYTNNVKPLEV